MINMASFPPIARETLIKIMKELIYCCLKSNLNPVKQPLPLRFPHIQLDQWATLAKSRFFIKSIPQYQCHTDSSINNHCETIQVHFTTNDENEIKVDAQTYFASFPKKM